MDLPVADVLRPRSMDDALKALSDFPDARPLAGGTDLVVQLRDGRKRANVLVDLSNLGLGAIRERDGGIEIGALAPMDEITRHPAVHRISPALAQAAGFVGAWPIQCRATLGGNLANASPAADTAPPLLTAGAIVTAVSPEGRREISIEDFFTGPGTNALKRNELIVSVFVPAPDVPQGHRWLDRFFKVGPRKEQIISVLSLSGRIVLGPDGSIHTIRLALGSIAPTPVRALRAEKALIEKIPANAVRREACEALQKDISPIDDVRAPARYRRIAAAVLLDRFLKEASGD